MEPGLHIQDWLYVPVPEEICFPALCTEEPTEVRSLYLLKPWASDPAGPWTSQVPCSLEGSPTCQKTSPSRTGTLWDA